jgi:Domain of unknown function (DUF4389)
MYPVTYQADYQDGGRNRLTTFFRYFTAIPAQFFAFLYAIGVIFTELIAWFALMFTARYPQGLYNYHSKAVRLFARANAYGYLLTDAYPPFNGDPDDSYPVRVGIGPPQERYSRLRVFFRGWMLIPVYIVLLLYGIGLSVVTFIAWFAILFTGRYPAGMFNFARNAAAYGVRASAFYMLLTDQFPPVNDEPQVAAAAPVG